MFYSILYFYATIALFVDQTFGDEDLKLLFVNWVWRHGARSPLYSFPSDPNKEDIWPQGSGQLTQVGMKQHYEFGSYLRRRYSNFLSKDYKREEIYIRSTDKDRTLMSAECNMDGLYKPKGKQMWNGSYTSWQPIPVHTVPLSTDNLLHFPPVRSVRYEEIMNKIWNSDKVKMYNKRYKDFFEEMTNLTELTEPLNFQTVFHVSDTLFCEKAANLTLATWVTDDMLETFKEIGGLQMGVTFGNGFNQYDKEIARLGAGRLVKQIVHNMQNSIHGIKTFKAIAYSAHDTTLTGLLVALDAYDNLQPPFASGVIFELHEKITNDTPTYIVRAFYRNSTEPSAELVQLSLLDCELDCPFSELKQKAKVIFPPNHADDQNSSNTASKEKQNALIWSLAAVSLLLMISLLLYIVTFCRHKSKKSFSRDSQYLPLFSYDDNDA